MAQRRADATTGASRRGGALAGAVRAQARELAVLLTDHGAVPVGGGDAERLLGRPVVAGSVDRLEAWIPDSDRRRLRAVAARLPEGGTTQTRFRARHADGSQRWLEGPLTNHVSTPGVEGFLLTVRDVTSEVEAREHLGKALGDYAALARFGAAIESIHDIDALLDAGMHSLVELLDVDFGVAHAIDAGGRVARLASAYGTAVPRLWDLIETMPLEEVSAVGEAVATGDLVYVEDYAAFGRARRSAVERGVRSVVALPVASRDVTHVLTLGTVERSARFSLDRLAVVRSFGRRLTNALERASFVSEVADTRQATFRALGLALEFRDLETKGHTDRVVALADALGRRFRLGDDELVALRWGAYLHDLGKVAVPDSILLKADRLTAEEFGVIAQHTLYGVKMCTDLRFLPEATLQVIRSHHERWDGGGYPDGLAGEGIPLLARIFAVVDVYDALRSTRPYKPSWSDRAARAEIRIQAGQQFDPRVVDAFFSVLERPPDDLARLLTYGG